MYKFPSISMVVLNSYQMEHTTGLGRIWAICWCPKKVCTLFLTHFISWQSVGMKISGHFYPLSGTTMYHECYVSLDTSLWTFLRARLAAVSLLLGCWYKFSKEWVVDEKRRNRSSDLQAIWGPLPENGHLKREEKFKKHVVSFALTMNSFSWNNFLPL